MHCAREGPNLTAPNLAQFDALPNSRIKTLDVGYSKQKVWLSAINRPATGDYMELRIQDNNTPDKVYSLEYREQSGFDASKSSRDWNTSERQPGEVFFDDDLGSVKVFRIENQKAEVEITPP
jgi:hypothetical protein